MDGRITFDGDDKTDTHLTVGQRASCGGEHKEKSPTRAAVSRGDRRMQSGGEQGRGVIFDATGEKNHNRLDAKSTPPSK